MVKVACSCGAAFAAAPHLAGKQVACPNCNRPLQIPAATQPAPPAALQPAQPAAPHIAAACGCGRTVKAKLELAGRTVKCPSCGQPLEIPHAPGAGGPAAPASAFDPFADLGTLPNDPLAGSQSQRLPQRPRTAAVAKPARSNRRSAGRGASQQQVLVMVTGILCVIHSLVRLGSVFFILDAFASGAIFSFWGLVSMASTLVSLGIGAAGIGLLTNQDWAPPLGTIVGIAYFVLLALSLVQVMTLLNSEFGARILARALPRIVAEAISPGLLVYVCSQNQ